MLILIPAYRPDSRLIALVDGLLGVDPGITPVVVDDGSGPEFQPVFDALDARSTVLRHPFNRGKGAALRTGLAHALARHPGSAVVTADADGQHTVPDILRVARRLRDNGSDSTTLVLGARSFTGDVPRRSRVGNVIARLLFRALAGPSLIDTQTGLRGIPAARIAAVAALPGDRFDFELRMLLQAGRDGTGVAEVPISTVYLDDNASSHFRPVVDSIRVVRPLLLFAGSGLLAFGIDIAMLWLLVTLTDSLAIGVIGARLVSASVNFLVNRTLVFRRRHGPARRHGSTIARDALRYAGLAAVLLATNYAYLETLTAHGIPLLLAKTLTESLLFVTSFIVQRSVVFDRESGGSRSSDITGASSSSASEPASRLIAGV